MRRNFLSQREREDLIKRHRKEKDGRVRDRIKVILYKNLGWSNRFIAEMLFIDEITVAKYFLAYQEEKSLTPNHKGSKSKFNEEETQELIKHLKEFTYLRVQDIVAFVEKKYGIIYTVSGLCDWLKDHGFSYKKPKVIPTKVDPQKQEQFVKEYNELKAQKADDEVILHGDAVHPEHQSKPRYGWIFKGENKQLCTVAKPKRMHLLGVLNLEIMVLHHFESEETIHTKVVIEFFKYIENLYKEKKKITIVLDNAMYFKSKLVKEYLKNSKIVLKYLPPYSPNLNPIERVWKLMHEKTTVNHFYEKFETFQEGIRSFFTDYLPRGAQNLISRINDNFGIICNKNPLLHPR